MSKSRGGGNSTPLFIMTTIEVRLPISSLFKKRVKVYYKLVRKVGDRYFSVLPVKGRVVEYKVGSWVSSEDGSLLSVFSHKVYANEFYRVLPIAPFHEVVLFEALCDSASTPKEGIWYAGTVLCKKVKLIKEIKLKRRE